jgi:monofunctional biosynthetic peptidoglycan transglycosylase
MARVARKRRRFSRVARALLPIFVVIAAAVTVWELAFLRIHALADRNASRTITVPVGKGGSRRLVVGPANPHWTPLAAISPEAVLCVLKAEDDGFYQHSGFDWEALRRAVEKNLEKDRYARGGSTITMQLAKNLFLWRKKSVVRKALEGYLTWRLETSLTKQRILELYLNVVEWGPGVYGIGEASRHYFEKRPAELTLGEAAMLAAIIPSPLRWNPKRAPAVAMRKQQELLGRLRRENALSRIGR